MYNRCLNLSAYADDLVLLSPSWRGLQYLIDLLVYCALSLEFMKLLGIYIPWTSRGPSADVYY